MNQIPQMPDFFQIADGLKEDVRRYAKVFCLQWFDDSFQRQGFTNVGFEAWEKRNNDKDAGRAILIDTTFLRKSLAVLDENENQIEYGTYVPYASLHNNGERMRVIQNVRAFSRTRKGKKENVKAHSRKIDTKYPKRQFIGESEQMNKRLDEWLIKEIDKRFKQL